MASTLHTDESSVMFNLRELWRLQGEREAEEARAEQTRCEAQLLAARLAQEAEAEQARLAQEAEAEQARRVHDAEVERARIAREQLQRVQVERDAALLRVQLEAAAEERSLSALHEEAHARDVEQAAARVASQWRRRTFGLLVACGLCGAGAIWAMQQQLAAVRGASSELETKLRETAALLAKPPQGPIIDPRPVPVQPVAAEPKVAKPPPASHAKTRLKLQRTQHSATQDSDLGRESSDPIDGL